MFMSFQHVPFIPRGALDHSRSAMPDAPVVPYREPVRRDHAREVLAGLCDRLAFWLLRASRRIEPPSVHPDRLSGQHG